MGQTRATMTASGKPKAIVATVTGKNQITIPAVVVRALELEPGMKVEFELGEERSVIMRPVLTRADQVRQIEEKWQPLFPSDSDPISDLIHEREQDDSVIGQRQRSRGDLARQVQGKWRSPLELDGDAIANLVHDREDEESDKTRRPLQS